MLIFCTAQSSSTIHNQRGYFNSLILQALELLPGLAERSQNIKCDGISQSYSTGGKNDRNLETLDSVIQLNLSHTHNKKLSGQKLENEIPDQFSTLE